MTPVVLGTKLNIGGRWYNSGSVVEMSDSDAADYLALRMVSAVPADKQQPARQQRDVKVGDVITKDGTGPRDPRPDPSPDDDGDEEEGDASEAKKDQQQPKLNPHPERTAKRHR